MSISNAEPVRARRVVHAIVREPLLHFAIAGGALFALLALRQQDDAAEIRISAADVAQLAAYWETQAQRRPSAQELQALVEERIDEEVLAREALQFGLDQDDVIIRRRLAQKMAFISEDLAAIGEPDEPALRAFFEEHKQSYATPARYAVRQVFFSIDSRGVTIESDALRALRAIERGAQPGELGDPFMLPSELADVSRADLQRDLGSLFADAVAAAPVGSWQGPVRSSFGLHLFRVESQSPAAAAGFEQVRADVREAYLQQQRRQANAAFRKQLRAKYLIVVEGEGGRS